MRMQNRGEPRYNIAAYAVSFGPVIPLQGRYPEDDPQLCEGVCPHGYSLQGHL